MKNINGILSKGLFKDRASLYFENLAINSVKEGTGEAGFLSEYEEINLFHSFDKKEERKKFNEYRNSYCQILQTLHKVHILRLQLEISAESYHWVKLTNLSNYSLLDKINELLYSQSKGITINDSEPKRILLGTLQIKDGFFEFENDKDLDLNRYLPLLEQVAIDKIIKVKSAIYAVEEYIESNDYDVNTHKKLLKTEEEKTINLCDYLNIKYTDISVDEDYLKWFSGYFLS